VVDAFRTNVVTAYQTNWVTQPVTNVVQVDVASASVATEAAPSSEATESKEASIVTPVPVPPAVVAGPVVLEAARTTKPPNNDQVEVQLRVKGNGDPAPVLQVQQWRVERQDRAILCFGQDQEFKRELPAGTYKVEVKVRQAADGPLLTVRGMLVVTLREAVIQQNLTAKR
jgi:hypothetical protein